MTTKELIGNVANATGMTKRRTEELLDGMIRVISDALSNGQSVQLRNFGTLEIREHKERNLIHPKTGEKMVVPAKKQVGFRPNAIIKDALK